MGAGGTSLSRSCQHWRGGAPRNPGPHGSSRRGLSSAPGRRLQVPELHLEGRVKARNKGVDPGTPPPWQGGVLRAARSWGPKMSQTVRWPVTPFRACSWGQGGQGGCVSLETLGDVIEVTVFRNSCLGVLCARVPSVRSVCGAGTWRSCPAPSAQPEPWGAHPRGGLIPAPSCCRAVLVLQSCVL